MPMQFQVKLGRAAAYASIFAIIATQVSAFETRARAAYVYDQATSTVLMEKNADVPLPPASMSKLMTLYLTFEFIKSGRISLDDKLPVSEHAASYGGSTMFLNTTDRVAVQDLLLGIIVLSGNDACAVLAEALSPNGTEAGFAQLMTERAKQLGLTNSHFVNSNGWPAPGQRMSMHDLGLLAHHIIADFPEFYPMFSVQKFEFDGRAPANVNNRNPLLSLGIGADGLKTGHTEEAGYGLVGSAIQGDRRVIFVLSGLDSVKARAEEAEAITNWAFRQFSLKTYGKTGEVIAQAPVWNGNAATVGLQLDQDVTTLVPILQNNDVKFSVEYQTPLPAPILKGAQVAELVVTVPGLDERRLPLVAQNDVALGGVITRVTTAGRSLVGKLIQGPEASQ